MSAVEIANLPDFSKTEAKASILPTGTMEVGDVFYLSHPVRLSRVIDVTQIEINAVPRRAVIVESTIPKVEIEGLISKGEASRMKIIHKGCKCDTLNEEFDERVWKEVWADIPVRKLNTPIGKPAFRGPSAMTPSVVQDSRINEAMKRTSELVGKVLEGFKLPGEPQGTFPDSVAEAAEAVKKKCEIKTIYGLPYHTTLLKKIASDKHVDITDLKGAGSMIKIIERITGKAVEVDVKGRPVFDEVS